MLTQAVLAVSPEPTAQPTHAGAAPAPAVSLPWDPAPRTGRKSVPRAWVWVAVESCEAVLPSPFPRALGERQPLHKKWWRNHGSEQEHLSLLHGDRGGER